MSRASFGPRQRELLPLKPAPPDVRQKLFASSRLSLETLCHLFSDVSTPARWACFPAHPTRTAALWECLPTAENPESSSSGTRCANSRRFSLLRYSPLESPASFCQRFT